MSASKNSGTSWGSSGVKLEHDMSNNLAIGSKTRSIYQEVDHQLKSQAVAEASSKTCSCVPQQSTDLAGKDAFSPLDIACRLASLEMTKHGIHTYISLYIWLKLSVTLFSS